MVINFAEKLKENKEKGIITNNINNSFVAKNLNLKDTTYLDTFIINADSLGYKFSRDGGDDRIERLTMSFFAMSATLLSKMKKTSSKEATALILQDMSGNFLYAGIVEYHENEENADEPGNWSYVTTFNEDDIKALEKKKIVTKNFYGGSLFTTVFNHVSYDIGCISWTKESYMYDGCLFVIQTLLQILDAEALPTEEVEIEFPGYFKASVAIENDEKIFSITPDGAMKSIIKSDIQLEK